MATTTNTKKEAEAKQDAFDPAAQLHEIQKLLFGQQMEKLQQAISELTKDVNSRLGKLEKDFKASMDAQSKSIHAQLSELGSHVEKLNDQHQNREALIEDDIDGLRKSLDQFEAQTEANHNELEKQLSSESNKLQEAMEEGYQSLNEQIDKTETTLDDNKLDRKKLAELLENLAKTISA